VRTTCLEHALLWQAQELSYLPSNKLSLALTSRTLWPRASRRAASPVRRLLSSPLPWRSLPLRMKITQYLNPWFPPSKLERQNHRLPKLNSDSMSPSKPLSILAGNSRLRSTTRASRSTFSPGTSPAASTSSHQRGADDLHAASDPVVTVKSSVDGDGGGV
jgi:hypothetical protein